MRHELNANDVSFISNIRATQNAKWFKLTIRKSDDTVRCNAVIQNEALAQSYLLLRSRLFLPKKNQLITVNL